ncbi:MAG TPA: pitrilysin family protein [Arenimonas sp.]|nr:pitrilysin family protein [Arenimonas sp.]
MRSSLNRLFFTAALALSAPAFAADTAMPAFERTVLANGTEVLLMEKHDVPLIAINAQVRGGSLTDPAGQEGTASLLSDLMQKGAGKRDAKTFAETVDGAGGKLNTGSSLSALELNAEFLSRDADLMLELASDALIRPTLDASEFEKVRTLAIQSQAAAKDGDPRGLIHQYGAAYLFKNHPYGRPVGGDETSLKNITLKSLKAYYQSQLGGDRLIISVVGDFKAADMKTKIEKAFGGWGKATGTLPVVSARQKETGRRILLIDKPGATQTYFWLGNVGTNRADSERPAQALANTVFGGRFTSMLNTELRIKSGLSYGAYSGMMRYEQPGPVHIVSYTRTDATIQAIDLTIATLDRLHKEGISNDMQESAKNYVLGQFAPTLETGPQMADKLSELALYRLNRDEVDLYAKNIRGVTPEQFSKAIAVYPANADLVMVLIGDAAKIRDSVKKYGPVTEMKISEPRFSP